MSFINWIKSHYFSILLFIFLLVAISSVILNRSLSNLDEIWNYNFAKNIVEGLVPYRDFNMLQTPLLPFIVAFCLFIFGNELIVSRILAILLISFIFFMIYKILNKLKVNKFYILPSLYLLFIVLKDYICIDYNFAILALTLLLIYFSLPKSTIHPKTISSKPYNRKSLKLIIAQKNNQPSTISKNTFHKISYKNNFIHSYLFQFLIGILGGCCILLKQSTGLIIAFISVMYPILLVRKVAFPHMQVASQLHKLRKLSLVAPEKSLDFSIAIKNKLDLKTYLKQSCIKVLGILVPIFLLLIYLSTKHAIPDFIDYTILGIKKFTNSIPYTKLIESTNILIKTLSIFTPIFIVIAGIYLFIKKDKRLIGFYFYALGSLVVIFPISDAVHFSIGITPFIVFFFYLFFRFIVWVWQKIKCSKKIKLFFSEISKAIISLYLIYCFITVLPSLNSYFSMTEKHHNVQHYSQIPISEGLLNKINTIDTYIMSQNVPVYILDAEAAIYMIPINRYYKDFNLFLKGNLGSQDELGQIEKIKNLEPNSQILIKNDNYKRNWQTPEQVISYIKNNLTKTGDVSIFDIYIK